jgi:drug/metabolite transporter (DMT)-like permease
MKQRKSLLVGILLASLAAFIWSWNFIIARGIAGEVPPVTINFFRWIVATIFILPFAFKTFQREKHLLRQHKFYLFWTALTGISVFNALLYVAGHYVTAINLALLGTTSSPVFAIILAAIFLKERISLLRILGLLVCIAGILFLLSSGDINTLLNFHFSKGDWIVLMAALMFAIYNTLVKRKPAEISPVTFLFVTFLIGTVLMVPFYIYESSYSEPVQWSFPLAGIFLFLGVGASVLSYFCWNIAIGHMGSARTALFGNLIPFFSIIEAVLVLGEEFSMIDFVSGILIIAGLVIANVEGLKQKKLIMPASTNPQ